ncbi:hypothetical protein J7J55_02845 [Candidatus Bipolaricaulota bacterium]|nr:hypothetical protein [Candidatus Bipolaricaulota bacterium]
MNTVTEHEEMISRYKRAVEAAIARLPVKNGVVDIDSIWVETSIPYDILQEILTRQDLVLPENVERVNLKSTIQTGGSGGKKAKKRRRNKVRH